MYKVINTLKKRKKLKEGKRERRFLNMAIIMFISFSLLNTFLIVNFINILNNVTIK